MRLLIIRHGDPDYENDRLTERGWKEAELLAKRIAPMDIKDIYVSSLRRAQETASCTLKAMNRTATEIYEWMQEFPATVEYKDNKTLLAAYPDAKQREDGSYYNRIIWDILPEYWMEREEYFHKDLWRQSEIAAHSDIVERYDHVTSNFDALLAKHGYERCGNYYRVTKANTDTIALFCHFGLECVLLSHLWGVSPFPLWHGAAFAPTSVTTIYTEERKKGIASFRAAQIGDISHLYAAGVEPSFSARFCEIYDDFSQRH
ncbi:MAG: histidine phosphatase family protein [Eubacteriales bacterium]|nr:histidine phosphatase family protein [Eubacteriales bacterium]